MYKHITRRPAHLFGLECGGPIRVSSSFMAEDPLSKTSEPPSDEELAHSLLDALGSADHEDALVAEEPSAAPPLVLASAQSTGPLLPQLIMHTDASQSWRPRILTRARSRSRARAQSRNISLQSSNISLPSAPTTPSDDGQVSDEEECIKMQFDCKLIMSLSGTILGNVSCNDRTCVGDIRHVVEEIVAGMRSDGVEIDYFKLLRGECVLLNDSNKIFEIFSNLDDCALTVAMMHKRRGVWRKVPREEVYGEK